MGILLTGVQSSRRDLVSLVIPFFSLFVWQNILSHRILSYIVESSEIMTIWYGALCFLISFGIIIACFLIQHVSAASLVVTWSIVSSVGTILIALVLNEMLRIFIFLLLGAVFGMGILAILALFWERTVPEERGRMSGLFAFISLLIFPLLYASIGSSDFSAILVLSVVLNSSTMLVKLAHPKRETVQSERRDLKGDTDKRKVLLFSIPWLAFSLINATLGRTISFHVSNQFSPDSVALLVGIQVVGGSIGALFGGLMADFVGRKLSLTTGIIFYGISSAILGLAQSYELFVLSHIGTGLTWGIFLTLYLFVVWGDLANFETRLSTYSIGLVIYYSATGIGSLFGSQLTLIPLTVASVVSCLFIFLSNIPLLFVPELLSRDFREKIRLKFYISLVKRKTKPHSNHE